MIKRRRRYWSDAEKRRIVGQADLPGVSVSEVARRYDVNANLVFKWLKDPRYQGETEASEFVPIEVAVDAVAVAGVACGASVPEVAKVSDGAAVAAGRIEIGLSNGRRLSVIGGFDPDRVVRLVRGLEG